MGHLGGVRNSSSNLSATSTNSVEEIKPLEAAYQQDMTAGELKDCIQRHVESWACMLSKDNQR